MKTLRIHTQAESRMVSAADPDPRLVQDSWRLPSGRPLGEFALSAGFLAPQAWVEPRRRASWRHVCPIGKADPQRRELE